MKSYASVTLDKALINDVARKYIKPPLESIVVDFRPQNWFLKVSVKGKDIKVQGRLKASGPDLVSFRIDSVRAAFLPIPVNAALSLAWPWIKKQSIPFVKSLEYTGGTVRMQLDWPPDMPMDLELVEINPGEGNITVQVGPPGSHPTRPSDF